MTDLINAGVCYKCKAPIALPEDLYTAAHRSSAITFYCAHGHPQHYPEGPTEADKLRAERDRLKQEQAYYEDRLRDEREARERAERSTTALKGQVTKLKNRAAAGVCPCCTRSFENLKRHMATKHPDFTSEAENVVQFRAEKA